MVYDIPSVPCVSIIDGVLSVVGVPAFLWVGGISSVFNIQAVVGIVLLFEILFLLYFVFASLVFLFVLLHFISISL